MATRTDPHATLEQRMLEGARLREAAVAQVPALRSAIQAVVGSLRGGGFLYAFGNGGSAADAQHLAAELAGRFYLERAPLPAIALTANTSSITAIGNDYSYLEVFSRQLEGCARKGDVVVAISTSGTSKNVLRAVDVAKDAGTVVIALCGRKGSALAQAADHALCVESDDTARIQEVHMMYYHLLCEEVEAVLAGPRSL